MKKANHQSLVVRLGEPRSHGNADALELFDIGEYQVVTKKGENRAGDLGVYFVPDSVVPQTEPFRWLWEPYVGLDSTVPEKRRRITVRRFRGQYSEGLFLPLKDFPEFGSPEEMPNVGDDVSELLGITHWDPDRGKELAGDNEVFRKKRGRWPRSLKGWWYFVLYHLFGINNHGNTNGFDNEDGLGFPVYDVEALKHYANAFTPGEPVQVSEKIHGSNARFSYKDGHMYAGSRTQWKSVDAKCIWRSVLQGQPWIETWCRGHEGYALFGEVTPTQGESFKYGSDKPQFFAFDIRTPDAKWLSVAEQDNEILHGIEQWVPLLYSGPYDYAHFRDNFLDGPTTVPGAKGIREGIVIRPLEERHVHGLGRLCLKVVSLKFLEKDSQ